MIDPAAFWPWALASAAVAGIAAIGFLFDSGAGTSATAEGPSVVIDLQAPPTAPQLGQGGDAQAEPDPTPPPQTTDISNALVAANGTVVIEPALLAPSPDGPVPVIAPDGRKPMHVYAARFDPADTRPRAGIILTGLGLSDQTTQLAIDKMPPGSTLSFSPYGQNLQNWVAAARAKGHEVLLELPMEPFNYPDDDPGTHALLTGSPDNPSKLNWLLARFSGYAGVVNAQGGKLMASADDLRPILAQVSQRGLFMAEIGMSQRSVAGGLAKETLTPHLNAVVQIDKIPGPDEIDSALEQLAIAALERRAVIGSASAAPIVIERISAWAAGLEQRGVAFAPVSAALPAAARSGP
jgi:hypothetical protein